jgi:hypothetical protein
MARFRCGKEEGGNRYWTEEEKRRCRMCRAESTCGEMREREAKEREEKENVNFLESHIF